MTSKPVKSGGTEGTGGTASADKALQGSPARESKGTAGTAVPFINAVPPAQTPPENLCEPKVYRPSYVTHDDWFRMGDRTCRPGLYWHGNVSSKSAERAEAVDLWICSPIHVVAITSDEHGGSHGLLLRFINPSGQWREWSAPMQLLKGSGDELRGELLDMGMRINPQGNRHLIQWLMGAYPDKRLIATSQTGWHMVVQQMAFVMPEATIGSNAVRFQCEQALRSEFERRGTLSDWQQQVAAACIDNPVLLLAVSIAFTGPLLKLAKLQDAGGIGFHLMGNSSQGKSTALQIAASVWSSPAFVRTWRATSNGLEGAAAALNDTLLVLDEISECDPREIGAIVYALANGTGKQRARRTGAPRPTYRWRIVALSSGERSLATHMSEVGKQPKAGQEARFLDVPATGRAHGAFDVLHEHEDGRALADALKQSSGQHYGHAGPAFVEALLNDTQDLPAAYAQACKLPAFSSSDGVENRAAAMFALVGMAGELATEYGLTGWQPQQAMDAAIWGFEAWRNHRGSGHTEQRQILNAVRDFLQRHGDSRFSGLSAANDTQTVGIRDRAGYWRDSGEDGRAYLFTSSGLREAAKGFDFGQVLDALEGAGWIVENDHGRRRSKKVKVAGTASNYYVIRPGEGDEP